MSEFEKMYAAKIRSANYVVRLIESGWNVVVGTGSCSPFKIMAELHKAAEQARDINVLSMSTIDDYPFLLDPEYASKFNTDCIFTSGPERKAYAAHTASYLPVHLNEAAPFWIENHPVNIFFGCATPMDAEGNLRLSPCLTVERDAADRADIVVLEVTPNHPKVYGDTLINIKDVDYIVESDSEMGTIPNIPPDAASETIGGYISELINDGDCIQLGIGAIPNAVALSLKQKHDLGIHTEMIISSMAELAKCGAVNNSKKTLHPGKMVGCFAVGDTALYDYMNDNPDVEFYRASYVIDPRVIMKNDNMVSINTGFGCDLTGQVASEAIGTRQYSGTGGQASTAKGAVWAKNGRSIIAFRSTAKLKSGVVSNIKAVHEAGTVISLSRNDVDYVVTEYGIAHLRGRSIRDRVESLIAIAHPDFRHDLRIQAEKYHI